MNPNTFPTKGNLILAKNSLALAVQGYGLMDKKRNILLKELTGLIGQARSIQSEIDSTFTSAYRALQKANIELGVRFVEEIAHMEDVRGLFLGGLWLRRIGLKFTLAFAALLYFWKRGRKDRSAYLARAVPGSLCAGTGVFFAACLALAAVISTDFSRYFVVFHHIFFDNDLWILDPDTDMLINIVPEAFFMDTALRIAIVFAIFVTIFFGACLFLWLKGRKAAEKGGN